MRKNITKISACLFFLFTVLISWSQTYAVQSEASPLIYFEHTSHTFPPVFEGKKLSHTFIVSNKGAADLIIKKVGHT